MVFHSMVATFSPLVSLRNLIDFPSHLKNEMNVEYLENAV